MVQIVTSQSLRQRGIPKTWQCGPCAAGPFTQGHSDTRVRDWVSIEERRLLSLAPLKTAQGSTWGLDRCHPILPEASYLEYTQVLFWGGQLFAFPIADKIHGNGLDTFVFILFILLCFWVSCLYACMCTMCLQCSWRPKKASDPPHPTSPPPASTRVNSCEVHYVGSGNETQVLSKSSEGSMLSVCISVRKSGLCRMIEVQIIKSHSGLR